MGTPPDAAMTCRIGKVSPFFDEGVMDICSVDHSGILRYACTATDSRFARAKECVPDEDDSTRCCVDLYAHIDLIVPPPPVDCVGEMKWGACTADKNCGAGTMIGTYVVTTDEDHGGECPLRGKTETKECQMENECINCEGRWKWDYSDAGCKTAAGEFLECGEGVRLGTYEVTTERDGGRECEARAGDTTTKPCAKDPCDVDCEGRWKWDYSRSE